MRGKKKGLETKVFKFFPLKDDSGRNYIPYCNFGYHQGVALRHEICEVRNCNHYIKLYLEKQELGRDS